MATVHNTFFSLEDTQIRIRHLYEWFKGTEWSFDRVQNPYTTVWLIINGERELELNEQSYHIKRGDLIIIPPYTSISLRSLDGAPDPLQYLSMGCEWKMGAFDFVNLYRFPKLTHLESRQFESFREIWTSLRQSWSTFMVKATPAIFATPPKKGGRALSRIKLQTDQADEFFAIKGLLFQWLSKVFALLQGQLPAEPTIMDERVQKVCHYINHHYRDKLAMHNLCQSVFLSESQLRVLFKKTLNISPMNYILQVRLQKAKELLMLTEEPICTIADEAGFGESSYFCRVFRKKENVSPVEYRQTFKNDYV